MACEKELLASLPVSPYVNLGSPSANFYERETGVIEKIQEEGLKFKPGLTLPFVQVRVMRIMYNHTGTCQLRLLYAMDIEQHSSRDGSKAARAETAVHLG